MGLVFNVRDVVVVEAALLDERPQRRPLVLDVEVVVVFLTCVSEKPPSHACVGATDVSDGASTGAGQTISPRPASPSVVPYRPL